MNTIDKQLQELRDWKPGMLLKIYPALTKQERKEFWLMDIAERAKMVESWQEKKPSFRVLVDELEPSIVYYFPTNRIASRIVNELYGPVYDSGMEISGVIVTQDGEELNRTSWSAEFPKWQNTLGKAKDGFINRNR